MSMGHATRGGLGLLVCAGLSTLACSGTPPAGSSSSSSSGGGASSTMGGSSGAVSNASSMGGASSGSSSVAGTSGASGSGGANSSSGGRSSSACNGCITELSNYGTYTREQIASLVDPAVTVENGYSVYFMWFLSDGRQARTTVTFPTGTPPAGGWHMVVNNPGTVGLDDPCALGGTVAAAGLAGYFGARGFIGVTVDYAGLGTQGTHPYLVQRVEATSSLDAVRAVQGLAELQNIPMSGRVAFTGLSQGGHATLAVAKLQPQYAPELDVRAYAAAAPASVFLEQWAAGVQLMGAHQAYHAMVVYAFNAHYPSPSAPTALWTANVATQVDNWMATLCPFSTMPPTLGDRLGSDPAAIFNADFLAAYGGANLDAYPAVKQGFEENRVRPFTLGVPLRIYQGTADDTVPAVATQALVAELRNGGMTVDYVEVPGGTHTNVAFGFLAYPQLRTDDAITWLRTQLDAP